MMTNDEKFYLAVAKIGLDTVSDSGLKALIAGNPERAFLYLFDVSFGLGFAGAQKMARDGVDIQALDPVKLSLIATRNESENQSSRQ